MVNTIFSNYQLACDKALEYSREIGEDIFVYEHRYPSGIEYSLSKREGGIFAAKVNMRQFFKTFAHAERYRIKLQKYHNRNIFVKEIKVQKNGYIFKEGYRLCFG